MAPVPLGVQAIMSCGLQYLAIIEEHHTRSYHALQVLNSKAVNTNHRFLNRVLWTAREACRLV